MTLPPDPKDWPAFVSVEDAANAMPGIGPARLRELIAKHKVPFGKRLGRYYVIYSPALVAYFGGGGELPDSGLKRNKAA